MPHLEVASLSQVLGFFAGDVFHGMQEVAQPKRFGGDTLTEHDLDMILLAGLSDNKPIWLVSEGLLVETTDPDKLGPAVEHFLRHLEDADHISAHHKNRDRIRVIGAAAHALATLLENKDVPPEFISRSQDAVASIFLDESVPPDSRADALVSYARFSQDMVHLERLFDMNILGMPMQVCNAAHLAEGIIRSRQQYTAGRHALGSAHNGALAFRRNGPEGAQISPQARPGMAPIQRPG